MQLVPSDPTPVPPLIGALTAAGADPAARLREVLCGHQAEILQDWTARVRKLRIANQMSDAAIVDHLPQILAQIARLLDPGDTRPEAGVSELGQTHAIERLKSGFELDQVVLEYRLLRRTVMDVWEKTFGDQITLAELRALDEAFDESIVQAVVQYAGSRERLLKGLNQVSEAAARTVDLDTFLRALLQATVEALPIVDTAVVLVREGDRLRVRAAHGMDLGLRLDYSVAIGEGFAGRVAQLVEPVLLPNAAEDPLVAGSLIQGKGVKALYGVPLVAQGNLIGVSHIGSFTSTDFSEENKLLFRTMASRAASYIAKARLQAQLEETSRQNQKLYDEARSAVATRDQLLAVVSHDMRNQLGVISNVSRALGETVGKGDEVKAKALVSSLQKTSVVMKRLVDDLLDSAAIRSGSLTVNLAPCPVDGLVRHAHDLEQFFAKSRGVELTSLPGPDDVRVLCDHERILQVMSNLLGNAIRQCSAGDSILLSAATAEKEVVFSVVDTGPGIAPAVVAHLFEPFRSGRRKGGGTGLGLYISKGIVDRHGGRIWFEPTPGGGASFFFSLPVA